MNVCEVWIRDVTVDDVTPKGLHRLICTTDSWGSI